MSFDEPRKLRLKSALPRYGLDAGAIGTVRYENDLSKTVDIAFGSRVLTVRADRLEEIPIEYSAQAAIP